MAHRTVLVGAPIILAMLCTLETSASRPWSRVLRDWLTLGAILAGYWAAGWFVGIPLYSWQDSWLTIDRAVLHTAGLQNVIEAAGSFLPFTLESAYFLLYAIPPLSLLVVYKLGSRAQVNRYLFILMLGTFASYALLPLFPTLSPRVAFPGSDLPNFATLPRFCNTWILDHLDISTSVFPSGHVAVAFSSAFGLFCALRKDWKVWTAAFSIATLVYIATIYGRYHYSVDGLLSLAIAFSAWRVCEWQAGE
jgi:membrane-associated phospholipid phosphatase